MPRTDQLILIQRVPQTDEGVRTIEEEQAEFPRHGCRVSELEDEAAAADAELQSVRRRYAASAESRLDAETDDQALEVDVVAAGVER